MFVLPWVGSVSTYTPTMLVNTILPSLFGSEAIMPVPSEIYTLVVPLSSVTVKVETPLDLLTEAVGE